MLIEGTARKRTAGRNSWFLRFGEFVPAVVQVQNRTGTEQNRKRTVKAGSLREHELSSLTGLGLLFRQWHRVWYFPSLCWRALQWWSVVFGVLCPLTHFMPLIDLLFDLHALDILKQVTSSFSLLGTSPSLCASLLTSCVSCPNQLFKLCCLLTHVSTLIFSPKAAS